MPRLIPYFVHVSNCRSLPPLWPPLIRKIHCNSYIWDTMAIWSWSLLLLCLRHCAHRVRCTYLCDNFVSRAVLTRRTQSSKTIYNAWFHSPVRIDILGTTFITLPFISNNICSIAAGIFADRGDDFLASQFTHALYYFWTIYCGSLGFMILVAGIRLLRLLEHHLKMQHDLRINIAKIKTGAFKVKLSIVMSLQMSVTQILCNMRSKQLCSSDVFVSGFSPSSYACMAFSGTR